MEKYTRKISKKGDRIILIVSSESRTSDKTSSRNFFSMIFNSSELLKRMGGKIFLRLVCTSLLVLAIHIAHGQGVGINEDESTAETSAILDVKSSTKGMLAPRMTASQRNSISSPATGLILFDTDANLYYQYDGSAWMEFEITSRGKATGDVPTSPGVGDKYYDETDGDLYIYTTGGWASIGTNSPVNSPYGTIDMVFGTASGNSIEITSWNVKPAAFDGYVILMNSENSFSSLADDESVFATSNYASNGQQAIFNGTTSTTTIVATLEYSSIYYFKMVPYSDDTGTRVYDNSQSSLFVTTTSCTYTSGTDTSTDEFEARNDDEAYETYFNTVESQVCYAIDVANSTITISSNQWPEHYMGDDGSLNHISGKFPTAYVVATETVRELEFQPTYDENNAITYVFSEEGNTVQYDFYQFGIATNGVEFHPMGVEPWAILDDSGEETGEENWEWQARVVFEDDVNLDPYGGHTTSRGNYHYHGDVVGFADEDGTNHSKIYGYAADGFPIYYKYVFEDPDPSNLNTNIIEATSGYELRSGSRSTHPNVGGGEVTGEDYPSGDYDGSYIQDYEYTGVNTDLDECNGRYGVTPEFPNGTYYYVITADFPITPNCFRGNPADDWIIGN